MVPLALPLPSTLCFELLLRNMLTSRFGRIEAGFGDPPSAISSPTP